MAITGGCLCGAVRFETEAAPLFGGHCYCLDCRKSSAGHSASMGVPAAAVKMSGEVREYSCTSDSGGTATRAFCPTCGSNMYVKSTGNPGALILNAAMLDDPEVFKPMAALYVSRAPSWDKPPAHLMAFETMPPR